MDSIQSFRHKECGGLVAPGLFEPASNPLPRKKDGGLDWTKVTAVRILEIEDTHG